jgi:hypothetical protein
MKITIDTEYFTETIEFKTLTQTEELDLFHQLIDVINFDKSDDKKYFYKKHLKLVDDQNQ